MPHKKESVKNQRIGESGYVLPDHIPSGEVVHGLKSDEDGIKNQSWRIGKSIGIGGFGEIYLCSEDTNRNVGNDATLAMKIEPHENGPLFVEMNFYVRAAKLNDVEDYRTSKCIKSLGMPVHRGSGSHTFKGDKYRFLVMDRLGKDLQHIFKSGKQTFPPQPAYNTALKILDSLEYIHSQGYVHNDIKAQNLLLGYGRTKENDLYLVDFGLVSKYHRGGVHLEYKPDERKAHDGTIEYTSRDAHIGAHSRRSDLEILGYNLVHWMSGILPWMDNLANHQYVHNQKNGFMGDIQSFLLRCFGEDDYPEVLEEYLNYVVSMEFDTVPNYDKCRKMFEQGLKKENCELNGKLDFSKSVQKGAKRKRKRKFSELGDQNFQFGIEEAPPRKSARVKRMEEEKEREDVENSNQVDDIVSSSNSRTHVDGTERNCNISDHDDATKDEVDEGSNLYAADTAALTSNIETWSWERVLCSDPEMLLRQASRMSETADANNPLAIEHRLLDEKQQKLSLKNPTPAMKEIIKKIEQREKEREKMTWQQQLQHFSNRNSNIKSAGGSNKAKTESWDLTPNLLTPAMEDVIRRRSNRVSVEFDVPITPDPSDSEEENFESSDEEQVKPLIRDIKGRRRLIRDFQDNSETSEDIKHDLSSSLSEQSSEDEGGGDNEETESYVNSSDEEDMFPTKSQNIVKDKHAQYRTDNELEQSGDVTSFGEFILPSLDTTKTKKPCSIMSSPPNGDFHGWKTPPDNIENRFDSCINTKRNFRQLNQRDKNTFSASADLANKFNLDKITQNRTTSIEDPGITSCDSDPDLFPIKSSSSESMFSTQSPPSRKEREKELDIQFEALFNSPNKREVSIPTENPKRKRKVLIHSAPKDRISTSIQADVRSSNSNSVNVVCQDMTSSTNVSGNIPPNSVAPSSKVRNKTSRKDRRKSTPSALLNNKTLCAKERAEYQCKSNDRTQELQEHKSNRHEHRKTEIHIEFEKEINLSMESVISSVCDGSKNMTEQEPSNSRLSYISHKSSSSGRVSRISCRSNSSSSLPSSQLEIIHKKEQRRRISIQNEDVPHIRNKDTLSKPIKSTYKSTGILSVTKSGQEQLSAFHDTELERDIRKDQTKILSSKINKKRHKKYVNLSNDANKKGDVNILSRKLGGKGISKGRKHRQTSKQYNIDNTVDQIELTSKNDAKSQDQSIDDYEDITSNANSSMEQSASNSKSKLVKKAKTNVSENLKLSKHKGALVTSKLKKKKQNTPKLLKAIGETMLLTPLKLGNKLAHRRLSKSRFITPIAARVKRLKRNHKEVSVTGQSIKSRAIAFNSSVSSNSLERTDTEEKACGVNVSNKLLSNKNKVSETCSSKEYPCFHTHVQESMPTTSTNMESSPIERCKKEKVPNVPAKAQSFVHDVCASKGAKSAKKKPNNTAKVKIPKGNLLGMTTEINLHTNRPPKSSDGVVTKYLKKFKGSITRTKHHSDLPSQSTQTLSKSSKLSAKGKGIRNKSKNEDSKCKSLSADGSGNIQKHLPSLKENIRKGSIISQDESVFKLPTKPVGRRKRSTTKACKNAKLNVDDTDDDKQSSRNPSNINKSKSDERKVLRSSRR